MNFELSTEQAALRDEIRRFLDEQYSFDRQRQRSAAAAGTDRSMWRQFGDMGWLGIQVPDNSGGLGLTLTESMIVLQEFGRGLITAPYLEGAVIAAQLLRRAARPFANAQLERLATGELLVSLALLEANKRYRLDSPATILLRAENGYRLSGDKILVEAGDAADAFLVLADFDGAAALLIVPADAKGLARRHYRLIDGGWASDISFNAVPLTESALLLSGAACDESLAQLQDVGALGAAALSIGCMDRILELSVSHLATRQQFGRPLASFQVLQHRMADLFVEIEMARSAFFAALAAMDRSPNERATAVSAGRVRVDQAALKVGAQGIHLHGGIGMTVESPVGHYYRRLLRLTRCYGDTEHHFERYERLELVET